MLIAGRWVITVLGKYRHNDEEVAAASSVTSRRRMAPMEARYLFIRRAISSFSCQYPPSVLFPDDVAPALRRWDSYPPPHILRRQRPSEGRLPFLISAWSSAWLSVGQILQGFVLRLCLWSAPVTGCFLSLQESRLYASGNFLQGADQANFSVYVHSQPGFVFNEETTRSQYFYNRQLNNSINVSVVHVIIDDLNLSTLVRKKWIFFSWNNSIKLGVVYVFGDLNISTPIKTNRVCFEDYEHMSEGS